MNRTARSQAAAALRRQGGIVVFSPLPPTPNGIADYCAELLEPMSRIVPIWTVIDDLAPEPSLAASCRVLRLAEYLWRQKELAALPHWYHVGNNADHVYMLPVLLRRPGVVVLHDASLHHLMDQATLRWGFEERYTDLLEIEYGRCGRLLGDQYRTRGWRSRCMFYELPMTREVLGSARSVVVHSLFAAARALAQAPSAQVVPLPHHLDPAAIRASGLPRAEARRALGLAPEHLLIVSLGFATKAKQIDTVLRFLARHRRELPGLRYVVAGQDRPEEFDVVALANALGVGDAVQVTGFLDEPSFYRWIVAADVIANLRYPSGGETSGTLIRALGVGACVVVNDIGPFAELPRDVCVKVEVSDLSRHDDAFAAAMLPLLRRADSRQAYGLRAAKYVRATHGLDASVERYFLVLAESAEATDRPRPEYSQSRYLRPHDIELALRAFARSDRVQFPLWAVEGVVPVAARPKDSRMLLVGGQPIDLAILADVFGYAPEDIDHFPAIEPALGRLARLPTYRVVIAEVETLGASEWERLLTRLDSVLLPHAALVITIAQAAGSDGPTAERGMLALLERHGLVSECVISSRQAVHLALDASEADDRRAEKPQLLIRARRSARHVAHAQIAPSQRPAPGRSSRGFLRRQHAHWP